jgi:hypothetical protein
VCRFALLSLVPTLLFFASSSAAPVARAQPTASFNSTQPIIVPLQPVAVNVSVTGYSGPATLLVFDSAQRPVGSFELALNGGSGSAEVLPRGALGQHWAALFVGGSIVAEGPLYTLEAETSVRTGVRHFDDLYPRVRNFMAQDRLSYQLDGATIVGYRSPDSPLIWLRDHYYQNRAFRYFESDLTSALDAFRRAQYPDGSLPDFLARPEWGIPAYRTPVEADVEYLYVQAVYEAWLVSGDDTWLRSHLEPMQRAIAYTLNDTLRWEPTLGLVKRPFTIDTWDFEYGPTTRDPNTGQPAPRHWIDEQTKWGIFHGDNTGLAEALRSLAVIEERFGLWERAYERRVLADQILQRLSALSWNGNFFSHHVKLVPYDVPGVDEAQQLSLSNAIALNRGVLSSAQGRAIVAEYLRRLQDSRRVAFAEWWSIDPPFPARSFGLAGRAGELPGEYVNGGVMPLVGGELARGAFRYGYEDYGFDILERYYKLIERSNATYLWYYPTGGVAAANEFLPTDGWGSSAMFGGLIEGAAGVEVGGPRFARVTLSPRWLAAPRDTINTAYVTARHAASDAYAAYRWRYEPTVKGQPGRIILEATGNGESFAVRILLPPAAKTVRSVTLNGQVADHRLEIVGESRYVVVDANGPIVQVQITFD